MSTYYCYQMINSNNNLNLDSPNLQKYFNLSDEIGSPFFIFMKQSDILSQVIYNILKETKESFLINTICDYDWINEEYLFKKQLNFYQKPFEKTNLDLNKLENYIKDLFKNNKLIINKGYVVCKEKKQYFDLSKINSEAINPLAILTRGNLDSQGGGDISFLDLNEIDDEFKNLVCFWKDCQIYFEDDISKLKNCMDISKKIIYIN